MNGTHPFISTTGILRRLYRVTMIARNNGVAVCHVLGGGTGRIFVDRELPLNVGDWQCIPPRQAIERTLKTWKDLSSSSLQLPMVVLSLFA